MIEPPTARELLALDRIGEGHFRNRRNLDNGRAIFGGQPMGQALAAARATLAEDWPAHNLTAHFLRGGDARLPIDYHVEATRDGRRYASRRVLASQEGKPIFDMLCAFHDVEDGPVHVGGMVPDVPPPEELVSVADFIAAHADALPPALAEIYGGRFPIELRVPDPERIFFGDARAPVRDYWLRMPSAAELDDPGDQQAAFAILSDYWLAGTAGAMHFRPSGLDGIAVVTLNHNVWFHAPLRADDWLLYATESPWADGGRGFVRGLVYDRAGALVASTTQEISIRRLDPATSENRSS